MGLRPVTQLTLRRQRCYAVLHPVLLGFRGPDSYADYHQPDRHYLRDTENRESAEVGNGYCHDMYQHCCLLYCECIFLPTSLCLLKRLFEPSSTSTSFEVAIADCYDNQFIPAHRVPPVSQTFVDINRYWDRISKVIICLIDAGLNYYFLRIVKQRLLDQYGLMKYSPLVTFNARLMFISVLLDVSARYSLSRSTRNVQSSQLHYRSS